MYKGKILKFTHQYAIVCSDSLAYEKIKLKPQMKIGQTIYYFEEDVIAPNSETVSAASGSSSFGRLFFKAVPVLAALFMVAFLFNHQIILPTAPAVYAVVSIDINPSVSLQVDEDGDVTYAEGKNNDGKDLLASLNLIDLPLEHAVESIIRAAAENGYLDKNKRIFIATAESDDQKIITNMVESFLADSTTDDPYTVYVTKVDYTLYEKAEKEHVSVGHYYMDSVTEVEDNDLFDEAVIDDVILDTEAPITKHTPKTETQEMKKQEIEDKQEERQDTQEQKKDNIEIKQQEKIETQEQKKENIQEKQEEKQESVEEKQNEKSETREEKTTTKEEKQADKKSKSTNK
ncbi:MAG: anti-sigma factor domain-containing protein [Clostridia bacterium]|nr:anti-sigma factor domain-containing protein [Clostridia bacterium]